MAELKTEVGQVVLHLTDLHFNEKEDDAKKSARRLVLDSLIREVKKAGKEWQPTVVCVSGDLAYNGSKAEFDEFHSWCLKFLSSFGLTIEDLVVCAGNHDLERGKIQIALPKSHAAADKILRTPLHNSLVSPFDEFINYCSSSGLTALTIGDQTSHLVGWREHKGIKFICLNSSWYCRGKKDFGQLWIGLPFLHILEGSGNLKGKRMGASSPSVCLVHHPKEWLHENEQRPYRDRTSPVDFLAERVDLILSGHTHGSVRKADTIAQGAYHVTGGATYDNSNYDNNFRLVRFLNEGMSFRSFSYVPSSSDYRWEESLREQFLRYTPQDLSSKGSLLSSAEEQMGAKTGLTSDGQPASSNSTVIELRLPFAFGKFGVKPEAQEKVLVSVGIQRRSFTVNVYSRCEGEYDTPLGIILPLSASNTSQLIYSSTGPQSLRLTLDLVARKVEVGYSFSWDLVYPEESLSVLQIMRRMKMRSGELVVEDATTGIEVASIDLGREQFEMDESVEELERLIELTRLIIRVNRRFEKMLIWPDRVIKGGELQLVTFLAHLASDGFIEEEAKTATFPASRSQAFGALDVYKDEKRTQLTIQGDSEKSLELWGAKIELGRVVSVLPNVHIARVEWARIQNELESGAEKVMIEYILEPGRPCVHFYVDLMSVDQRRNLPPRVRTNLGIVEIGAEPE